MFGFRKKNKQKNIEEKVEELNRSLEDRLVSPSLDINIATLRGLFKDVDIMRLRHIENTHDKKLQYCIAFSDGMIDSAVINDNIIKPLLLSTVAKPGDGLMDNLMKKVIQINESEKTGNFACIIRAVTYGDTVLFAEGANEALILNTKAFETRAVVEPDNEKNLLGPREGFTESLMNNLSLVRRRVRTHELKMKFLTMGQRTQTSLCVCYMEGIVNKTILNELYQRLGKIDIDGVLDTNYIAELIRDTRFSPFRTTGYTERPDTVVGKLLEGRIAVFLDGSPVILTAPYLFIENFQSSEDYYMSFYYSSFARILRILAFILTISIPGLYIAIVAFHHEMLPSPLLINIASERQSVPFPAALEAFIMLLVFDILRETGIRMPSNIGHALSIVGALVIGQAAVEAKLVAAPMIIVVATTGITSLLVPKLNAPILYLRFLLLLAASIFGFFGVVLGLSCLMIHMINLESFGIPQMALTGNFRFQELKDNFIRAPWWKMQLRPNQLTKNQTRMKESGNGDNQ